MIVNPDQLIEYLAKWLAEYAKAAGKNTFVVGFRGTRPDSLLLHICSKAIEMFGGLSAKCISCSIDVNPIDIFKGNVLRVAGDSEEHFYLQCHRVAEENGIVVGSVDKTFGLYYRDYGKRSDGNADIFPLFDLEYSDIYKITENLWPNIKDWDECENYIDIEFANEAENLYGIITNPEPPNKHPRWPYFIASQKAIIALVWQREKSTRHKNITRPYPIISDKPQLCR
jgi:hypothetical protein